MNDLQQALVDALADPQWGGEIRVSNGTGRIHHTHVGFPMGPVPRPQFRQTTVLALERRGLVYCLSNDDPDWDWRWAIYRLSENGIRVAEKSR